MIHRAIWDHQQVTPNEKHHVLHYCNGDVHQQLHGQHADEHDHGWDHSSDDHEVHGLQEEDGMGQGEEDILEADG